MATNGRNNVLTQAGKPIKERRKLGNVNAVTVGDSSPALVTRLAKDLKAQQGEKFLEDFPWLQQSDHWAIDLFWEKLAQYRLCRRFCARKGGDHDRDGKIRAVALRGDGHWRDLMQLLEKLGGTPASRYSLRLDAWRADDLAARAAKMKNGTNDY